MKDLCIRESYQKDGTEKVSWNKIGVLIDGKEGNQYVKLYRLPGVIVHVFDQKKKEAPAATPEAVNPEDVNWSE